MTDADDQLDAIYAQIPEVECKGLCHEQCSIVPCSETERQRMLDAGGEGRIHKKDKLRCPYLTRGNRCKIYAARPLLCRLYGAVEDFRCPHGCKAAKPLTAEESQRLVRLLYGPEGPTHVNRNVADE